jgi:hypothetical protein
MSETEEDGISQIAVHCFHCYHGRHELVTRDEVYPMTDGSRKVLPRVNYFRCMECGEELLTSESDRYSKGLGLRRWIPVRFGMSMRKRRGEFGTEIYREMEQDEKVIDRIAAAQREELEQEIATLQAEAERVAKEARELAGEVPVSLNS